MPSDKPIADPLRPQRSASTNAEGQINPYALQTQALDQFAEAKKQQRAQSLDALRQILPPQSPRPPMGVV